LPQPRFSDLRRFCEIDGWDEQKGARGKRGHHFRYRKVLPDGRILRTKASHSDDEIGRDLWRHIWREQLALESEDQFREALETGKPVDRIQPEETAPSGPSLPAWLVDNLIRQAGVPPEEVSQMSEEEARERLNEFYARPAK
jgi:hypothetical protein